MYSGIKWCHDFKNVCSLDKHLLHKKWIKWMKNHCLQRKFWLCKLANGRLHLSLCKDTDSSLLMRCSVKWNSKMNMDHEYLKDLEGVCSEIVWSDAGQPQKPFKKAIVQRTLRQSETSYWLRNLLSASIGVYNWSFWLALMSSFCSCSGLFENDQFRLYFPIIHAHDTCKDQGT
jgi:hypothetical protein